VFGFPLAQFKPLAPPLSRPTAGTSFFTNWQWGLTHPHISSFELQMKSSRILPCFGIAIHNKVNVKGHVMFSTKKINSWVDIDEQSPALSLSKAAGREFGKGTQEAFALTGISLNEHHILFGMEKYRSQADPDRRPTSINTLTRKWVPLFADAPFPRHTSDITVASAASAYTLRSLFGESVFHLVDSSEVAYGLPIREFGFL